MTSALFSTQWYRIAPLRPRLRPQVQVQRQQWRGQRWYLLSDASNGRQHRLNDHAWQFIGRCDGRHTVQDVWDALLAARPEAAPTQDEVLTLLGQLDELELLQSDRQPDAEVLLRRRDERRGRRRRALVNPLAFRLPLGDPQPWLQRLDPLARVLMRPAAFWLWLLLVLSAGLAALTEWPALRADAARLVGSPSNLVLMWLLYPPLKALHELGHALALRRWGGEVHEAGIGLLLLVPAPYVDASAAAAFASRRQRALVGAAGILVELALAAGGLWLWLATQPGWLHDAGLALALLGTTSSLLFNGNPLLRYDGYHVMCDLLDLANLGPRSRAWWSHGLAQRLLGVTTAAPGHAPGERIWLIGYAPLSLLWQFGLALAMVQWLGASWVGFALLGIGHVVVALLWLPLQRWARLALDAAAPGAALARVRLRLGLLGLGALLLLAVVPLPHHTVAPALVWLPEQAQLRAEVEGFVAELPLPDGAAVQPGDVLLRLDNPDLRTRHEQLQARLDGLHAEHYQALQKDLAQGAGRDGSSAANVQIDLEHAQQELARLDEQLAQLTLRAQVAGRLVLPQAADWPGRWVRHGAVLGHVLAPQQVRLRAVVPEADAVLVRQQLQGIEVRLADRPGDVLPARLAGATPAATRQLPGAALGQPGGGPIPVDPADRDGVLAQQPQVLFDLEVEGLAVERVGMRAWVRFEHEGSPLIFQLYRRVVQMFLRLAAPSA